MASKGNRRSSRHHMSAEPDNDTKEKISSGPRRSGRHAITAADSPAAIDTKKQPKSVPEKSSIPRSRTSTPIAKSSEKLKKSSTATSQQDNNKRKGGNTSKPSPQHDKAPKHKKRDDKRSGSRTLRTRAAVSLKETSDDEDDFDDSDRSASPGSNNGSQDEEYDPFFEEVEEEESDIDETIYDPPAAAALSEQITIPIQATSTQPSITIPSEAIPFLMSAYATLRSFSWQLRLSPFPFDDFCIAMHASIPTQLMDEIHVCVLRSLATDEIAEERTSRLLDLSMLDAMTWPCFVWEWLRLIEDPLSRYEWIHRKKTALIPLKNDGVGGGNGTHDGITTTLPAAAAAAAVVAPCDGDQVGAEATDDPEDTTTPMDVETAPPTASVPVEQQEQQQVPLHGAEESQQTPAPAPDADTSHLAVEVRESEKKRIKHEALQKLIQDPRIVGPAIQPEYYDLSISVKAEILSRLCDCLLDCVTFRAEIDRREVHNEFVTGTGGEGSAYGMMTPDEKAQADALAQKKQQTDANAELCMLCGQGGNLICCDSCPAAYHMRCLGETGKSLGEGDWFCPECAVGGRGEAAGLRFPVAGRSKWKQPHYLFNGNVVRMALPSVQSRGRHAEELSNHVAGEVHSGEGAMEVVKGMTRVRHADEVPLASSFEAIEKPPQWNNSADETVQNQEEGLDSAKADNTDASATVVATFAATGAAAAAVTVPPAATSLLAAADEYVNRYRNGWSAYITFLKITIDEAKKRKHKGGIWIPTGTCGRLVVQELPVPLPLPQPRFPWEKIQGRAFHRMLARCGTCRTCMRPHHNQACLNPVYKLGEEISESAKMNYMVAFISRIEREFWALADGPWATEPGGGMQYRTRWISSMRSAENAAELAAYLVQLESALRPIAFVDEWYGTEADGKQCDDCATGKPSSQPTSRVGSMANLQQAEQGAGDGSQPKSDPYDIRFERFKRLFPGDEWDMDRRHFSAHATLVNRLPNKLVQKAGRQGGIKPIPGIKYRKLKWSVASPRIAWIAEAEAVQTTSQLAMVIRKLEAVLQWDAAVRPRMLSENAPFADAMIKGKRPAVDTSGSEYLVMEKKNSPEAIAAAQQQQQQLASALFRQQLAMSQAYALAQLQQQQQIQLQQQGSVPAPAQASGRLGSLNQWPSSVTGAVGVVPPALSGRPPIPPMLVPPFFPPVPGGGDASMRQQQHAASTTDELIPHAEASMAAEKGKKEQPKMDEAAAIAKRIVATAIKKALEEEERMKEQDAPAAMAAKLRSRQSASSSALAGKGDGNDKKRSEQQQPMQQAQQNLFAQYGFMGVRPVLPFPAIPPAPAPQWIHEKKLPLWMVRGYEEMSRREAANAAARELQAAARIAGLQGSTTKQAARDAALAAAQAAADACGVCSAAQGDNPDLDALWICCDTCNRWFHGQCVAMSQTDIDEIGEDDSWDCPGCSMARRKAERAARREGRAPVELFSPSAESDRQRRTNKPFYERADYKAQEQRALERLKRSSTEDGPDGQGAQPSKRRGRPPKVEVDPETAARRAAERAEKAKRKREEEEEKAQEEPLPVYCPVCQQPDYGRELIECDACKRWFHSECLGSSIDVIEHAIASNASVQCAECQGKRVRPPSQAAIDAAILAAAKKAEAEDAADEDEEASMDEHEIEGGERPEKRRRVSGHRALREDPSMPLTSPGKRITEANWVEIASKIIVKTSRLPSAAPFGWPVTAADAEDYLDIVSSPMDLNTLRTKLPYMPSPLSVLSNIDLIVSNCVLYNGHESEYTREVYDMKQGFLRLWTKAGMPMSAEEWNKMKAADHAYTEAKRQRAAAYVASRKEGASMRAHHHPGDFRQSSQPQRQQRQPRLLKGDITWQDAAAKVLRRLINFHSQSAWFSKPVSLDEAPGYFDVVTRPMDLGTVLKKVKDGEYASPTEALADVELIWSNCRLYNGDDHAVTEAAEGCKKAFEKSWSAIGLTEYVSSGGIYGVNPPQQQHVRQRPVGIAYGGGDARHVAADWLNAARNVLDATLRHPSAHFFSSPVTEDVAPDYFSVIRNPMDLGTVRKKLCRGQYGGPYDMLADVRLVFDNSREYNDPEDDVYSYGNQVDRYFLKAWQEAGLPLPHQATAVPPRPPPPLPPQPAAQPGPYAPVPYRPMPSNNPVQGYFSPPQYQQQYHQPQNPPAYMDMTMHHHRAPPPPQPQPAALMHEFGAHAAQHQPYQRQQHGFDIYQGRPSHGGQGFNF